VLQTIEECEVYVSRTHQLDLVSIDQFQEPRPIRFADDVIVPERRVGPVQKIRRQVEEQSDTSIVSTGEVGLQPGFLRPGSVEIRVQDLRVDDDQMVIAVIEAVPGLPEPIVVCVQAFGCHGVGRHRWVGFVTDVVVACAVMQLESYLLDLPKGLVHCLREPPRLGRFLGEITHMDDKVRIQLMQQGECGFATMGLVPPGFELEGPVTWIDHIVGIGDHAEFEVGGWKVGAVEQGFSSFCGR
jgi:hypothetical protein